MTEAQLFEKLGRLTVQAEEQAASYDQLLALLAKVVSGEVDRSRVLVNLTGRSWLYVGPGERPARPPTINGLPEVVVAPDEPVNALEGAA